MAGSFFVENRAKISTDWGYRKVVLYLHKYDAELATAFLSHMPVKKREFAGKVIENSISDRREFRSLASAIRKTQPKRLRVV